MIVGDLESVGELRLGKPSGLFGSGGESVGDELDGTAGAFDGGGEFDGALSSTFGGEMSNSEGIGIDVDGADGGCVVPPGDLLGEPPDELPGTICVGPWINVPPGGSVSPAGSSITVVPRGVRNVEPLPDDELGDVRTPARSNCRWASSSCPSSSQMRFSWMRKSRSKSSRCAASCRQPPQIASRAKA